MLRPGASTNISTSCRRRIEPVHLFVLIKDLRRLIEA